MGVTLILLLLLVILIDLTLFRPRRRKMNERAMMLNSISEGQTVYTDDGIRGKVIRCEGADIVLGCGPEQVKLTFALDGIERVKNYDKAAAKEKMKRKIQQNRRRL